MLHEARDWSGTKAESKAVHDRMNVTYRRRTEETLKDTFRKTLTNKMMWIGNIMADLHLHQSTTLNR